MSCIALAWLPLADNSNYLDNGELPGKLVLVGWLKLNRFNLAASSGCVLTVAGVVRFGLFVLAHVALALGSRAGSKAPMAIPTGSACHSDFERDRAGNRVAKGLLIDLGSHSQRAASWRITIVPSEHAITRGTHDAVVR